METTTMSDFLKMLLEDVKTNKSSKYAISDYSGFIYLPRPDSTFTIQKEYKTVAYLKVPKDNKFDFILDEIKKTFPNQYKLILGYDFYAKELIYVVINTVVICLNYAKFGDGKSWLLNTAKELTKPIAFSNFLEMLLDAAKNGKQLNYTISNYDMCIYRKDHELDGNIFSAFGEYDNLVKEYVYLEIPQANKYDFIFNEIRKAFPNQYMLSSVNHRINISIKDVEIYLFYEGTDGERWMFYTLQELGLE